MLCSSSLSNHHVLPLHKVKNDVQQAVVTVTHEGDTPEEQMEAKAWTNMHSAIDNPFRQSTNLDHRRVDKQLQSNTWKDVSRKERFGYQRCRRCQFSREECNEYVEEEDGVHDRDQHRGCDKVCGHVPSLPPRRGLASHVADVVDHGDEHVKRSC